MKYWHRWQPRYITCHVHLTLKQDDWFTQRYVRNSSVRTT